MISAKIVAHSYGIIPLNRVDGHTRNGSQKVELVTYELVVPKWMVAEINTDRMKSRNSASSRAIPVIRMISLVEEDWFEPQTWRYANEQGGMQAGAVMSEADALIAREIWNDARQDMLGHARRLAALGPSGPKGAPLGAAKEHANRLLEAFLWTTVVITGTEWDNWFTLRLAEGAQPEFQTLAQCMKAALEDSTAIHRPTSRGQESWHLPYVTDFERKHYKLGILPMISARRIAAVSYKRQGEDIGLEREIARAEELRRNKHWSPFEGPAQFMGELEFYGPYLGFKPLRKFFKGESGSKTHGTQEDETGWMHY